MIDFLLSALLWIAVAIGVLFVLALIVAVWRTARYGDARGPASQSDREIAAAWRRVLERELTTHTASGDADIRVVCRVPIRDAATLGVLPPIARR